MQILELLFENPIVGMILLGAIVLSITVHEAAHAYSAYWLGDPTPKMQGRLSFNPLVHLDLIGLLLVVFIGIGWGRPVEFNPAYLKNQKRDIALIALAGPAMNIFIALICALVIKLNIVQSVFGDGGWVTVVLSSTVLFALLNIRFAIFNLIPVDPLDGFKVVAGLLPFQYVQDWYETRKYGFIVLMILLLTGMVDKIVQPITMSIFDRLF